MSLVLLCRRLGEPVQSPPGRRARQEARGRYGIQIRTSHILPPPTLPHAGASRIPVPAASATGIEPPDLCATSMRTQMLAPWPLATLAMSRPQRG
jgi:hypothetical protein